MKETMKFETESKQLLSLMINSIYSNNEIFLRELISNASDAIDKYRFLSLTDSKHNPIRDHEINISLDKKKKAITISDNGVGMNKEELITNLGTIAKSGSKEFLKKMNEAKEKGDMNIIGQFGVGFYSAFMVANKIEVRSKKEGEQAYLFTSDGVESYTIEECDKSEGGTEITIFLKKDTKEVTYSKYLEEYEIKNLIKRYSDYIRYPIKMEVTKTRKVLDKDGKETDKTEEYKEVDTLNSMIPLWKKNKKDVTDEDLNNFYKEKFSDYEDPELSLFVKVDGNITYDALLYIPSHQPYNLYSDSYEKGLQLYSKEIFIKERAPELIPDYLKFVKGLVDSPDFNLNISREILQETPMMKKVAENVEKKIVAKLKEVHENDKEKYLKFWKNFGEHIKYGIYSSYGMKKDLLQDLLIFKGSKISENEGYECLKAYVERKPKEQKYIYYASGESVEAIKNLPQMEKYLKKDIDVLLLDDKIDEFAIMMLREYNGVEFKSISDDTVNDISEEEKKKIEDLSADNKRLLDNLKEGLKEKVGDVVISSKLVDSPVCLSTKEGLSLEMEKTLNEQPGMENEVKAEKVLEINPNHELFQALSNIQDDDELVKDYASVLYDEAMLLEGREISNASEFVKKVNELFTKALKK